MHRDDARRQACRCRAAASDIHERPRVSRVAQAVFAAMTGGEVHVHEQIGHSSSYRRIASFGSAGDSFTMIAHLAYRGRSHYDALDVAG